MTSPRTPFGLLLVVGRVALASIGFVGTVVVPPSVAPETAMALPPLVSAAPDGARAPSFKDYDAFLRAYQNGKVKRLAIVASLSQGPRQVGRFASLRHDLDR